MRFGEAMTPLLGPKVLFLWNTERAQINRTFEIETGLIKVLEPRGIQGWPQIESMEEDRLSDRSEIQRTMEYAFGNENDSC